MFIMIFLSPKKSIKTNILLRPLPDKKCPLQDNDESSFLQHDAASQGHCAEHYCEKNVIVHLCYCCFFSANVNGEAMLTET